MLLEPSIGATPRGVPEAIVPLFSAAVAPILMRAVSLAVKERSPYADCHEKGFSSFTPWPAQLPGEQDPVNQRFVPAGLLESREAAKIGMAMNTTSTPEPRRSDGDLYPLGILDHGHNHEVRVAIWR
jgi:hypothetical protein